MQGIPSWVQAGFRGFVAAALVPGAFDGYRFNVPQRLIAAIIAFGSGVLITVAGFLAAFALGKTGG